MLMRKKTMSKDSYKKIEIILDERLSSHEVKIIDILKKKFPKKDFFFEIYELKILFNLHSINLTKFEKMIEQLVKTYNLKKANIFVKLIKKIKGIKSYGLKTGKRVYVGYNKERKVKDRKSKSQKRVPYYYTRDNDFTKEINLIPKEYENKIICGKSEEILSKLPSNCVDLVFTSPPYNFGLDGYENSEDAIDWEKYFNKLFQVFSECIRVTKYGGRILVNVQPLFSDYIPIHHIISNYFMEHKLIWKGEIMWEKHNYNCKYSAWGSWKSPSSPYLKYTWEYIEIFCKGDLKKDGAKEDIDIEGDEFKKWVYAKWEIAPERKMKEFGNPAMFPEKLAERALKLWSFQNDIILDPFNGAGTTTLVAKKTGRRYLGIDISEQYCDTARKRISDIPATLEEFGD